MNSILCFGDCNVDIIIPVDEIPVLGGCAFSSHVAINIGGAGLNTTIALRRLGLETAILSRIGGDIFGSQLKKSLLDNHVNVEHLKISEFPTGLVVGLVSPNGEKRWISVRENAADIHMNEDDIRHLKMQEILYICGVELVEGKESRELAITLASMVKKSGGMVYLDPNIRVPSWKIDHEVKAVFGRIYPYVDVFMPNEKELELLGGSSNHSETVRSIIDMGVSTIWLKLGSEGCSYYTKDNCFKLPGINVKTVDTSGAGDAFNAAIIYGTISGFSPEATGIFANLFASFTVTKYGTTQAFPDNDEIGKMIQKARETGMHLESIL